MKAVAATVIAVFLPFSVSAYELSTPTLYSNLFWKATSNVGSISSCNELRLNAVGDLNKSFTLSMNGYLNCPTINQVFTMTGTAYFRSDNHLVMNLSTGRATTFECVLTPSFNGTCDYIYNPADFLGTLFLTWQ